MRAHRIPICSSCRRGFDANGRVAVSHRIPNRITPALYCGIVVPPFPAEAVHACRDVSTNQSAMARGRRGEDGTSRVPSHMRAWERELEKREQTPK